MKSEKTKVSVSLIITITLLCVYKVINHSGVESVMIVVSYLSLVLTLAVQSFFNVLLILTKNRIKPIVAEKKVNLEKKQITSSIFNICFNSFAAYSFYTHDQKFLAYLIIINLILGMILVRIVKGIINKNVTYN